MRNDGPIIDMTPRGEFVTPPGPDLGRIVARLAIFGVLLVISAIAFWAALFVIPVLIVLGLAFYAIRQLTRRDRVVIVRR